MKQTMEQIFAEYDAMYATDIVVETRNKFVREMKKKLEENVSLLKANNMRTLTKLARGYFKRNVSITFTDGIGIVNVGAIGMVYGYTVQKKRKYYHLIKTGNV